MPDKRKGSVQRTLLREVKDISYEESHRIAGLVISELDLCEGGKGKDTAEIDKPSPY